MCVCTRALAHVRVRLGGLGGGGGGRDSLTADKN